MTFTTPVTAISADYYGGFNADEVTVEAFDETSNSLGTATAQPAATDTAAFLGIISDTPIASITITAANDDGELLDNLRFGDVSTGPSDVIFADGFDTVVATDAADGRQGVHAGQRNDGLEQRPDDHARQRERGRRRR